MKKLKTSVSTSDYPKTHWEAVYRISKIVGKDEGYVMRAVNTFFGRYGLRYFINNMRTVNIRNFGKFYFHKKTLEAYEKMLKNRAEYYHALRRATSRVAKRKKLKEKRNERKN